MLLIKYIFENFETHFTVYLVETSALMKQMLILTSTHERPGHKNGIELILCFLPPESVLFLASHNLPVIYLVTSGISTTVIKAHQLPGISEDNNKKNLSDVLSEAQTIQCEWFVDPQTEREHSYCYQKLFVDLF